VGDQFGETNRHLLAKVYGWFYFAVNTGSFVATLLIPYLLDRYGPNVAFAIPGVLMLLATVVFWMGRNQFVHVPPAGMNFVREVFSLEGLRAIARLLIIYVFVMVFWALYDQSSSAWVLQAEHMNRHWLGYDWLSSQVQAVNPLLILIYIPLFSYVIYPVIDRVFPLTPLRKISIGLFVTAASFAVPALVEVQITAGAQPSIGWQVLAYVLLTAGEVLVSITCLEFSYTQAPKRMKSLIMALYYLSISTGNLLTAGVNYFIQNPDGTSKLPGASYYWFFTALMCATAIVFIFAALRYKEQTYLQDEAEAA
jgi:POT family proton-dependent oligopeptide transporter